MRKSWIIVITTLIVYQLSGQTHNPKLWYLGYQTPFRDTNSVDTGFFLKAGSSVLDFRKTPLTQFRVANTLSIGECNAFIFDDKDSLVLYSNGSKVFNRKHRLIERADSLNYGENDWANSPFTGNYFAQYHITLYSQAITILPIPNQKNKYALISIFINGDTDKFYKITYSVLDMNLNNGLGKMTVKESTVALGDFTESINAVRHGNGRDWWLIAREYSKKCFTVMLLDSTGIRVSSTNQCSGFDLTNKTALNRNSINRFGWDGKLFVSFTFKGIEIFNFNRCNGLLTNRREVQVNDAQDYMGGGGFSPDSKLLYANHGLTLYQIELATDKILKIAEWDGFKDTTGGFPYTTGFSIVQLAPDGKLYYTTNAFTHYLHRIDNPNVVGLGCNVVQRAVKIQTLNSGIPHFPNFELGVDTCWRSGIEEGKELNIEVYPNPARDYVVIATPSDVIPAQAGISIKLTNMLGQEIPCQARNDGQGRYVLDVRELPQGIYLLTITDKENNVLKQERIVIQRDY